MIHSYSPASSDNESLQADVMRFMAIIAFCLIAILALVKEVEPTPLPTAREQAPAADRAPAADKEPSADKEPAAASNKEPAAASITNAVTPKTEPPAVETIPEPISWQAPIAKPEAAIDQTDSTPKPPPEQPRLEVSDLTSPISPAAATPETESAEPEDEGLSLRFASPGDFLRLIARDQIQVYAFNNDGAVLGLNAAYDFLPARSPGTVYELLPQTIPALIIDALKRSDRDPGDQEFSWGITMPQNIESKIIRYIETLKSGELVIDRYGEVHHVASR